jgi:hypothetical protein
MYGSLVVLTMLLLRVVIPVGLVLWAGEAVRRRDLAEMRRISGQA